MQASAQGYFIKAEHFYNSFVTQNRTVIPPHSLTRNVIHKKVFVVFSVFSPSKKDDSENIHVHIYIKFRAICRFKTIVHSKVRLIQTCAEKKILLKSSPGSGSISISTYIIYIQKKVL